MRKPLLTMFNTVPKHYDLVNRILTLGLDERWRRRAAMQCLGTHPTRVMDICCGTGDMAIHLAQLAKGDVEIIGVDFSEPMLAVARYKAKLNGLDDRVVFETGDAANLSYPDGHFNAITISFGFRNLTYRNPMTDKYLKEILRVLQPGSGLFILETCQPSVAPIRILYHLYLKHLSSTLGALISGQRGAYRYLGTSAANYFDEHTVRRLLMGAGFTSINFESLLYGIAAIYIAKKH